MREHGLPLSGIEALLSKGNQCVGRGMLGGRRLRRCEPLFQDVAKAIQTTSILIVAG